MPMIASAATAGNKNQNAGERGTKRKRARGGREDGRVTPVAGGTVVLSMKRLRGVAGYSFSEARHRTGDTSLGAYLSKGFLPS